MQGTKEIACPVCGPSQFRFLFQKKGRHFHRCPTCRLELQDPLPTSQELADYYESSFTDGMYSTFTAADEMKRMTADQRLKEIKRDIDIQGRWMDVGCANGVFTKAMVDQGIDASGVEISAHAVAAARQQGLQVMAGTIDDVPLDHGYDGMTAFDVLEHVISPTQFLASIHKRLRVGGHVVLTVPDTGTLVRKLMGSRSFFYIPEEHLHYFDSRNLAALLRRHGFEIVSVGATHKPMTYDYSLTQFAEYNPLIYRVLSLPRFLIPTSIRNCPLPLPIGELRIIAKKIGSDAMKDLKNAA